MPAVDRPVASCRKAFEQTKPGGYRVLLANWQHDADGLCRPLLLGASDKELSWDRASNAEAVFEEVQSYRELRARAEAETAAKWRRALEIRRKQQRKCGLAGWL